MRCPDGPRGEDLRLIDGLRERSPQAQGAAWLRFRQMVAHTLRRQLGSGHDVEDLTQEVFMRLFSRAIFVRHPELLGAFVKGIALRLAKEEFRKRRVRQSYAEQSRRAEARVSPASDDDAREALLRWVRAVDGLSPSDRTLYLRRIVEGRLHSELCAETGLSLSTVRRRLRRLASQVGGHVQGAEALAASSR
jgi:RNA polymerase sigma-70 factor (ECF subfamily)